MAFVEAHTADDDSGESFNPDESKAADDDSNGSSAPMECATNGDGADDASDNAGASLATADKSALSTNDGHYVTCKRKKQHQWKMVQAAKW